MIYLQQRSKQQAVAHEVSKIKKLSIINIKKNKSQKAILFEEGYKIYIIMYFM